MHRIRQANSDRNRSLSNDSKPPDAEQGRFAILMREFNVVIELVKTVIMSPRRRPSADAIPKRNR